MKKVKKFVIPIIIVSGKPPSKNGQHKNINTYIIPLMSAMLSHLPLTFYIYYNKFLIKNQKREKVFKLSPLIIGCPLSLFNQSYKFIIMLGWFNIKFIFRRSIFRNIKMMICVPYII